MLNTDAINAASTENLPSERSVKLRQELSKVLLKTIKNYEAQKKILVELEGFLENGNSKEAVSTLNIDLLESLKRTVDQGSSFADRVREHCDFMYKNIKKLQLSTEERLRIECRVDELKTAAEKFTFEVISSADEQLPDNCRVLEINEQLGVVLLPLGYLNSIGVGRCFTIPEADNAQITVISLRQLISAAVVTDGSINKIAPGMLVEVTQQSNLENKLK